MSLARHRDSLEAWHPYAAETASFNDLDARIHVWRLALDGIEGVPGDSLSEDERARAERFSRPEDRRRFMAARGALRLILSDLLGDGDDPQGRRLRFGYGSAGKPVLIDDPKLHFNVSHSEDLAVIAATRSGEVGIDVEQQRPMAAADMEKIARLVFNEAEWAAMLGCPPVARETVFYRIWTRKEALLKAMGLGLPGLKDPEAASLAHAATAWSVTTLPHLDGFVASLARPRSARGLRLWSWPNALAMRSVERRTRPRPMPVVQSHAAALFEVRR